MYVEGLSYAEAATALDIPSGTLTNRLVRSRIKTAEMTRDPSEQERRMEQK